MIFPLSEQGQLHQVVQDRVAFIQHTQFSLEGRKEATVLLKRAGARGKGE